MLSIEQLAQRAYAAYFKKAIEVDEEGLATHATPWLDLDADTKACWVAVTQQLHVDLSAVH